MLKRGDDAPPAAMRATPHPDQGRRLSARMRREQGSRRSIPKPQPLDPSVLRRIRRGRRERAFA